ncbi:hypothetical protein CSO01_30250 [Cellulomonas soli]|uniref:Uncharacterized protein n=1 Tax=Cellulomonas soli TaxID=931535 RepID=A0A512PGI2_9CELL|nr:hypothetical protein CSO01_30250 [Cellulomonas soli]
MGVAGASRTGVRVAIVVGLGVGGLVLGGCARESVGSPTAPTAASAVTQTVAPAPSPSLCAEFHVTDSAPGDVEGWWSSSPADADGNVLTDPARWPEQLREHPRVALVDTDTGAVISSWDRATCGPDDTYAPVPSADWPTGSIAVVDMDTGETIATMTSPQRP